MVILFYYILTITEYEGCVTNFVCFGVIVKQAWGSGICVYLSKLVCSSSVYQLRHPHPHLLIVLKLMHIPECQSMSGGMLQSWINSSMSFDVQYCYDRLGVNVLAWFSGCYSIESSITVKATVVSCKTFDCKF